ELSRTNDFRASEVILQAAESVVVEFRVAAHNTGGVDQGDAPSERGTGGVGQRIGVDAGAPLRANEAGFALQLTTRFLGETIAQPAPGDRDDADDESYDEDQRTEEESFGERHALRECPLLRR
ncbi:MAG TPA: hypothetical protein VI259_06240, partial [Gemmatimonadaceae bacterium]